MTQLFSHRRLKRAGVELVSITQEFADDPAGNMMRNIVAIFDQHQSEETAKHTRRTMRSEEHTSELQSLMRISYAVFCLKKKKNNNNTNNRHLRTKMH